jgi:uncharacterized membrane protein YecN with MAPEG domain
MAPGIAQDTFVAYGVTALILCLNLLALWGYSGGVRTGSRKAPNQEDAALFRVEFEPGDPPEVARVLRAYANAQAMIFPFLLLGLLYVLAGGPFWIGTAIFAIFVIARLAHSGFYLAARQPWRTVSFVVSGLATIALMAALIWRLLAIH